MFHIQHDHKFINIQCFQTNPFTRVKSLRYLYPSRIYNNVQALVQVLALANFRNPTIWLLSMITLFTNTTGLTVLPSYNILHNNFMRCEEAYLKFYTSCGPLGYRLIIYIYYSNCSFLEDYIARNSILLKRSIVFG